MLNYVLGDAFIVKIIRARPYGSGFCGLRCASEHPADGSSSGPANPSREFFKILRLEIGIDGFGLRPGLLRARFARFLLRKEPSPAYPYRGFNFMLNYFLGDDF